MSAIFTGTRSRTHSKQVPNERGTSQEGFKCIPEVLGPGGAALGGRIPPKLEIAQHREKSGDPGSIPCFGDFLSDSRLFPWEKEGDGKVMPGGERGGVRGGRAPPPYGASQGGYES